MADLEMNMVPEGGRPNVVGGPRGPAAQPRVTVKSGATRIGWRPTAAERTPSDNKMPALYQGDYDTPYGGVFGEQVQEGRGLTVDALGMHRSAATGAQPSAAQILGQQGLDQAVRGQQSLAASARGAGALAMAQQQAGYNTAAMQQQAAAQMAALRAQEMEAARNSYLQGAMGMRGQDMQRLGMNLQRATTDAQLQEQNREGASAHAARGAGIGAQFADLGYRIAKTDAAGDAAVEDNVYNDRVAYQNAVLGKARDDARRRGEIFKGALEKGMDTAQTLTGSSPSGGDSQEEGDRQKETLGDDE